MKAITLTLKTEQPILATSFQGDPNSDVSYSYIPGSMIRGAIIGCYMRQHRLSELDLTNNEVKRLFFNANSTRYLNAYLLSQEKKRTLPVPLSWFKDKDAEFTHNSPKTVYDFSIKKGDDPENPKSFCEYFWTEKGGMIYLYKEKRRINIHNFRDRKKGRSTDNQGEIFRYDALDAGQIFQSIILCEDKDDVETIQNLLEETNLWLGGSQSAGYGQTKIVDRKPPIDNWNEIGVAAEDRENDEILSITLLSDTLLRNEHGQPVADPNLIKQAVEEVLNITLQPKTGGIFASSTLIGGFNRKWGLPLPQVPGLTAGSVVIFEDVEVTSEQINLLESQGIGDRREDGFGRVAVNSLREDSFSVKLPKPQSQSSQSSLTDRASNLLAEQMAQRLLDQKFEQELQKKVAYLSLQEGISNSQLSRLQSVARQALINGDCNLVLSLLNDLPSNARNQFERTKIGNKSFKDQLEEWLRNPTAWIRGIEVKIADVERKFDDTRAKEDKLAEKYTLRLIMAVAKKATKEKK
ncbi:RAMP superfamily CRISPR-associated protein [Limnoraphis robusta Tam1]|uniref:RAMP superfamily CRISPR-associated protein n=1 Tax=Limnoraphis robusta TaxID=1118279 RepID=UPI002B1F0EAF|nr:RAMP superfamily CRISPR-associated protein [Limnoraphis robusta]MEA5498948.1 RAMP superfamily CRISPR-associated protein [Limnoraphis robusta BA-68 BA1]MEA5539450.1 RAMP superfamily CRISPR-associated protein [Limnoraphis robusta Tam1]